MTEQHDFYRQDRHQKLLQSLGRPELPAALSSQEFLEGIYERALDRSASRLATPLREALQRVQAPKDVAWCEPETASALTQGMRQLPRRPAPGLLWPRIRADLRSVVRHRRQVRRLRFAAIAAVLLVSSLMLFQRQPDDRSNVILIKEISLEDPFQTLYSQRSIVKTLTRGE